MGDIIPSAKPRQLLHIDDVADVVRFLIRPGRRQIRPRAFVRTMGNAMTT